MPTSSEQAQRAENLLQRFFEGALSEEEGRELLAIWKDRPDLKQSARSNYDIETTLRFFARLERNPLSHQEKGFPPVVLDQRSSIFYREPFSDTNLLDLDELVRLAGMSPALPKKPVDVRVAPSSEKSLPPPLKPPVPDKSIRGVWLVVGCLLFFVVAVYFELRPRETGSSQSSFQPIAQVESVLDVQWTDPASALKEGRQLEAETLRFRSGIVQLTLKNGVRIALRGPADFRLNTVGKVFCGEGELSVTVPPTGKGFEVVTPFMSIVDRGTEFLVAVRPNGIETHTIRGSVELQRLSEKKIDLAAGNAFRLDAIGTAKHFVAEPNRFLTELFVRTLRKKRDDEQWERWKTEREKLAGLAGLRLFYDFESDIQPNQILGARLCEGRWQEKKAYSFQRKNDAIAFNLPGEMTSMTLFASLKIDSLDRFNHVIVASRSMESGHFIWQICSDGSVQLAVKTPNNVAPVLYRTRPILDRRSCGAWYRLATVVDAAKKEVRTYLDGELRDTVPMPVPSPLKLDDATLGNLLPEKRTATDSSLGGRIDQFAIFDRPIVY